MGHIAAISRAGRGLGLAVSVAMSLALGGCGGVEFQGKVFDYMGLSGDHQQADVRMAERPPLLLPPNLKQLPQPGTGVAVATARPDWPTNPEVVQNGVVTAKGIAELKQRMPHSDFTAFEKDPRLDNMSKLFTVNAIVNYIEGKLKIAG